MNPKRRILFAALIATTTAAPAQAGCLDWLFGHHHATPTVPYAVGYAPATTVMPLGPPTLTGTTVAPYAAGYAPYTAGSALHSAGHVPYTAGYAPYAAGYAPYAAGYAGLQSSLAAQAPAYGAVPVTAYSLPRDNASVLTGRPVMQTSATAYMGGPALPPAAVVPAPQPPTGWFGQILGNQYQTSYYGAPTTSYRPVTQIDPNTGAVVTVQQPCTSVTQQVQRSPYTSLQPAVAPAAPYYGEPGCGGEPPRYAPPMTTAPQGSFAPQISYPPVGAYQGAAGVSQATAIAPNYGTPQPVSPIPSTGSYGQPNYGGLPDPLTQPSTQPLTGYPGGNSGDMRPLAAPQLDSYRPSWQSSSPSTAPSLPALSYPPSAYPPSAYPSAGGTLVAPPLPSAAHWPQPRTQEQVAGPAVSGADATRDRYSDIAPIPAADNYRAPAWSDVNRIPNATTVDSGHDRLMPPAPASATLAEPRTASSQRSLPDSALRYASSPSALPALPASATAAASATAGASATRDDSGWFVIPPR